MPRIKLPIIIAILLLTSTYSFADEQLSFKGIMFGMKAPEIAKLGGGDLEFGCASAIARAISDDENPWTYGGVDDWYAICAEGKIESMRVPGTSGLIELSSMVISNNSVLAKWAGKKTYSVEELVEIFSKVFGKFQIDKKVVQNGLGQEFIKKKATAMRGGAVMTIEEGTSGPNHEDFIHLKITSLDYISKKENWEKNQNSQKLKDAKSDL